MKLPSFQQIIDDARHTFLRFPFVLINAALGTIAAVLLIDHEGPAEATVWFNILLATILGIPLLTGFALFAERKKWRTGMATGLQIIGLILLAGYGYSVPSDLANAPAIHFLRLMLFGAALSLFVTVAPFTAAGEINGFWHYNKILLLRLIMTGIYTVVLYAGLALALAALDNLFGVDVPGKRYAELWFIILGIFSTWSFLAGIPENLNQLERSSDYPKGIKIFSQYILAPLVIIYLLILYAYMAKILIAWDWPQGWVGTLILGFATTSIFSFLLLYPIREQAGNIWIQKASRWLYVLMIPLVMMLLLALWRRISEYGITENRYIAIVLALWLGFIVIYFIVSRRKSIKTIPVTLSLLSLFISFGPWGAFSVSENSQVNRLHDYLTRNNILLDNHIQKAAAAVSTDDAQQISSIISYLHNIHGYERIQPWFQQRLKEDSLRSGSKYKEAAQVTKMMGIDFVNVWKVAAGDDIIFRSDQAGLIDIHGYERMIRGQYLDIDQNNEVFIDQEFHYRVSSALDTIIFIAGSEDTVRDSLSVDLNPLFTQLLAEYGNVSIRNIPIGKMMLTAENLHLRIKMVILTIRLQREKDLVKAVNYSADILVGRK